MKSTLLPASTIAGLSIILLSDLNAWLYHKGSTKYGMLDDGNGYIWDADSGNDEFDCPESSHYRLYAPPSDRMYNTTYGYYVFATTHEDHYHYSKCDPGEEKFGWSESASNEVRFASIMDMRISL